MWKVTALICLVLLISCYDGTMKEDESEPKYFTVTYHGNGHTSGEPPVYDKQYLPPLLTDEMPPRVKREPEIAYALEPGTLEKEGYSFHGWLRRSHLFTEDNPRYNDHYYPKSSISGSFFVEMNIDLDASWQPNQ